MFNNVPAIFQYTFMQHAVLAAIISSIICGVIGTIIVERNWVSISGGMAHASFGGIGLGYLLNFEPIIGGLIFTIITAVSICFLKRKVKTNVDTLIGMFWSVGMALGIIFIALTPRYTPDMTSYLFGNILTVSAVNLIIIAVLTLITFLSITLLFPYWQAYLFDEEYLMVLGINVTFLNCFLLILIALCIISLVKIVGIVLAIALLTIPPATARHLVHNLKQIMILSTLIGLISSLGGLYLSYHFNIASGATIVIFAALFYLSTIAISRLTSRR